MTTYEVQEVPASGSPTASRYAVATSPGGWNIDPDENLALCLNTLAQQRHADTPELVPESKTIHLKRVAINDSGEYVLIDRGAIRGTINREPVRPGRFAKTP